MSISYEKFSKWAISRFGEDAVVLKGKEVRINTIFQPDDHGHHLWCSPSGGKKKRKNGVFHCFKTDKKGDLIKLVQIVDNCDRYDAIAILGGRQNILEIEKQIEELLNSQEEIKEIKEVKSHKLSLPTDCELIADLGKNNWWRKLAENYLLNRCIPIEGLYVCMDGQYKGRIIIPYYDKFGSLIYWNARHMGNSKCKYLGPPKESGVGKEDVVFMAGKWAEPGQTIHLCEGEFNAISLKLAELNGAACGGKNMGEKQALMLMNYNIVLCLDRDKAGKAGTTKMTTVLSSIRGSDKLMFVMPPEGYNDWNEMLVKVGPVVLHHYILNNQKSLDYSWPYGTTSASINELLM